MKPQPSFGLNKNHSRKFSRKLRWNSFPSVGTNVPIGSATESRENKPLQNSAQAAPFRFRIIAPEAVTTLS